MTSKASSETFPAPGPGGWRRLADHFPRALTAEYQRIYRETCPSGMASYMERYGVLARTVDIAFVNGHLYITPVPLAGPRDPRRTPPRVAVWTLSRLHPAFRARNRAARRTLEDRPWRAVTEHWFAVERQQWRERNAEIEAVDPTRLDDPHLAEHLHACRQHVTHGYQRHFELHGDDLLPVGLLITRCHEWGIDAAMATSVLAGAATAPHAADVSAWMLVTGYDLDCLTSDELGEPAARPAPSALVPVDLGRHVSAEHRKELEVLVADARGAVRLRDDNGALTGAWPMGLLRRAMLAAGQRLFSTDPTVAVEATVDELASLLTDDRVVTIEDLDRRRHERAELSALQAPAAIGPEFAIPPLDALPRPLALIGAAQLATAEHMLTNDRPIGIGTDCYTGRALVVDDPTVAMGAFEPGDVIITPATSPAWNALLGHAGALVTSSGGLVSHAAVTARELGIVAIIGDPTACQRVRTGSIVTVDPVHATLMMAPIESAPTLVVLHAVRINGRAPTARLAGLTGLPIEAIDDELSRAVGAGWMQHHDGIVPGWSLTPGGRLRHLELLTQERAAAGRDDEILAGYDDLMRLDHWFKRLCTEWQLHDHLISCIDRLAARHPEVDATTRRLADALTRFRPYRTRFSLALRRLQAGDHDAFTTPLADSYHDIWMQLHEDLLVTLGRERSAADGCRPGTDGDGRTISPEGSA